MMPEAWPSSSGKANELAPCGPQRRKVVTLFKTDDSRYWQYDFTVREHRYRGSTKETNRYRAEKIEALKKARALEKHDPLPKKPPRLLAFCSEFLEWVD